MRRNTYGGRALLADLLPIKAIDSGRRERGCRLLGTSYARREREVSVAVPIQEILELTRGFLFRDSLPLLGSASELIAPPAELTLWIIGEPAPLFFHFPAELLPVAFETVPIHVDLLLLLIIGGTIVFLLKCAVCALTYIWCNMR